MEIDNKSICKKVAERLGEDQNKIMFVMDNFWRSIVYYLERPIENFYFGIRFNGAFKFYINKWKIKRRRFKEDKHMSRDRVRKIDSIIYKIYKNLFDNGEYSSWEEISERDYFEGHDLET